MSPIHGQRPAQTRPPSCVGLFILGVRPIIHQNATRGTAIPIKTGRPTAAFAETEVLCRDLGGGEEHQITDEKQTTGEHMKANTIHSKILSASGSSVSFEFQITSSVSEYAGCQISVQITRIEAAREAVTASCGGSLAPDGSFQVQFELEDGLYEVASATLRVPEGTEDYIQIPLEGDLFFSVPRTADPRSAIAALREDRENILFAPILAEGATEESPSHGVVVFFSGVKLHDPLMMEGLWALPAEGQIGIESLESVLTKNLTRLLERPFTLTQRARDDYARSNPVFCVVVPNIRADSMDSALQRGLNMAFSVANLLAIERGERARRVATYYSGEGGESLWPEFSSYRGNILAPLSSEEQAYFIEQLLPLMQRDGVALLYVNLLAEAVGERNIAYQHFRYWALLEQIAVRKVVQDNLPLRNPDGTAMVINGRAQLTRGALRKVFYYLAPRNIETCSLDTKDSDGNEIWIAGTQNERQLVSGSWVISFFDALEVAYELRNQVAHLGHFDNGAPALPRQVLAQKLRSNFHFNSWFRDIVKDAVLSELHSLA